jgi:hypothetical protein
MLGKVKRKIERSLYHRGYHEPGVRKLVLNQILILLASVPALLLGGSGQDFFCGVFLGTLNFLCLARIVQEVVQLQRGAVAIQLFSFYGRLALTALAFYLLIVLKEASVVWLLAGVSTVLINILLWGMTQFLGKTSKEA